MTDREIMEQAADVLQAVREAPASKDEIQRAWIVSDLLRRRLAQPEQEPVAWRNAALRVGEDLCSVGPFGYYDMTAQQWLDWALSVVTCHPAPQLRPWVGLTDEEIDELSRSMVKGDKSVNWLCRAIEAKLKEKNI